MRNKDKIKAMESANKRLLGESIPDEIQSRLDTLKSQYGSEPSKTLMYHCDAKSCEHYKEKEGTTNCMLKQISISAVGDCNQFEPKSEEE